MSEKYRPSNATEGDSFIGRFCEHCALYDTGETFCPILGATLSLDTEDPGYPEEWVMDASGPHCTEFQPEGEPPHYRCPNTVDMFAALVEGGAP